MFGERACIVPVNFGGGRVLDFAPGDLPIDAMGKEPEARFKFIMAEAYTAKDIDV